MISFALFIIIMNKIFYQPVLKIMKERQKFIDANYNDAKSSNAKTEAIYTEKEERLGKSARDSKAIVNGKVNETNDTARTMLDSAKKHAAGQILKAKSELEAQQQTVTPDVNELAQAVSAKILGEM
ncbi:MAG: ATP synthase F0 subunit B [Heliobacteriaceae bacterium]|nr:ATP synthase F0 subunit B [Heliobacteriaceae bacterium]